MNTPVGSIVLNYAPFSEKLIVDNGWEREMFWTLERTEEDAIKRCKNETEAYGGEDESPRNFHYYPLTHELKKWHHCPEGRIETRIQR